jgi:SanA protein
MDKRTWKILRRGGVATVCAVTLFVLVCYVAVQRASRFVVPLEELEAAPVALVLGAKVKANGEPSDILRDRLLTGIELYHRGLVETLLLSGDDGQIEYDEVNAMRVFALGQGVAPEDIFLDHAGFDTYDSMVRAREVFGVTSGYCGDTRFSLASSAVPCAIRGH